MQHLLLTSTFSVEVSLLCCTWMFFTSIVVNKTSGLLHAGEEVAIAAAVLDLFWRLPKTAVKFLETQHPPALPAPGSAAAAAALTGGQSGAPAAATTSAIGGSTTSTGAVAGAAAGGASGSSNQLGLVVLTIQLEERLSRMPAASSPLPRILTSEYREPLLKFLDK